MPMFNANLTMLYTDLDFMDRFAAAAADGFKAVEYLFPYAYDKDQQASLTEDKKLGYQGVKVYDDGTQKVFRAAYVLYNKAILIEVFTDSGPADPVKPEFQRLLQEQVTFEPPTMR